MTRVFQLRVLTALSLTLYGCEGPVEPASDALRTARVSISRPGGRAEVPTSGRGIESEFARLEARIPGFGGFMLDPRSQDVVVVLTDTSHSSVALAVLRELAPSINVPPGVRAKLGTPQHTSIRLGRYPFSSLLGWQHQVAALKIPGIVGLDADERANRVTVGVLPSVPLVDVIDILRRAGIPASATTVHHQSLGVDLAGSLWNRYRPVSAGYQISAGNAGCTLGFAVSIAFYEQQGYLTAAHCAPNAGSGLVGAGVYQPIAGTEDNRIATVSLNPPWNLTDPLCSYPLCSQADVMFADHNPNAGSFIKRVVATFDWNQHVNDNTYGDILFGSSGWGNFAIVPYVVAGSLVYKVGKTTGITAGYVEHTCVARSFTGDTGPHTVLCVDYFTGASTGPGDSGGPVFYPSAGAGTQPYAIGIAIAGGDSSVMTSPDAATNLRCTAKCGIYFSEWNVIQNHLNRYLSP